MEDQKHRLTSTQSKLRDALHTVVREGTWEAVSTNAVRYTETMETPEWARDGYIRWNQDTYDRHIFLDVIAGKPWTIILGVSDAPWTGRSDSRITMKRAFEILANPASAWYRGPNAHE